MEPRIVHEDGPMLLLRAGNNDLIWIGGVLNTFTCDDLASAPGFTTGAETPIAQLAERTSTQILPLYLPLYERELNWRNSEMAWAASFEDKVKRLAKRAGVPCTTTRQLGVDGIPGAVKAELRRDARHWVTVHGYSDGSMHVDGHMPDQGGLETAIKTWLCAV